MPSPGCQMRGLLIAYRSALRRVDDASRSEKFTQTALDFATTPSPAAMTLAWLLWVPTARAQFNDTYRFTFTSVDGLCDFDGASKAAFDGEPFTLDSETGYRTSAGRSSGASGCWFVGTGVTVEGRGIWKPNADTSDPPDPVHAFLYQTNQQFQSVLDTENYFNVSADNTTLLDVHGRELRSYELRFTHMPDSQMEFHNMTVDVPIRTQA